MLDHFFSDLIIKIVRASRAPITPGPLQKSFLRPCIRYKMIRGKQKYVLRHLPNVTDI